MTSSESPDNSSDEQKATPDAFMSFRGSITVADAYAAMSLAQPLGNKIASWVIRVFFVLALLFFSWVTAVAYKEGDTHLSRMAFAGVLLFLLPICFVIGRELYYRRQAHHLCNEKNASTQQLREKPAVIQFGQGRRGLKVQ